MTEEAEVEEPVAAAVKQHRVLPCVPTDPLSPSKGMDCSARSGEDLITSLKTAGSLGRQGKVEKRKGESQ